MPALIFDCDGVLADTERDGHFPAFNQVFSEFVIPIRWSDKEYAEKVKIGGGKERMASVITSEFANALGLAHDDDEYRNLIARMHARKTEIYKNAVMRGALPGRPGVARLVEEAFAAGWQLAVASTSAETSVRAVLEHVVGRKRAADFEVFAGDIVPKKKPAPDIYLLALERLGVDPADVVVIEDSGNGLKAALGAGLKTIITVSGYTVGEDFTGAALVVSSLGSPSAGQPSCTLDDPFRLSPGDAVTIDTLAGLIQLTEEKIA